MRFVARSVVMAILLMVAVGPTVTHAQIDSREGIALQNQVYQLRQELRTMQDQMSRGGGARPPAYPQPLQPSYGGGNDLVPQLLTRVDALEEQVRQLRGRMDETQNQLQQLGQDLNKKIDDLAFQANPQVGRPALPPSSSSGSPAYAPPPAARLSGPVNRTPELALQEGNAALNRRDYPAAETAAREALANRTSPRAYDAKLLLAQALQGERQYPQAAVAFDDAYNMSRKGSHAQDALLGLATSLGAIKELKASCDTLSRLHGDFPQLRPDIRDGAAAAAQKASCR